MPIGSLELCRFMDLAQGFAHAKHVFYHLSSFSHPICWKSLRWFLGRILFNTFTSCGREVLTSFSFSRWSKCEWSFWDCLSGVSLMITICCYQRQLPLLSSGYILFFVFWFLFGTTPDGAQGFVLALFWKRSLLSLDTEDQTQANTV